MSQGMKMRMAWLTARTLLIAGKVNIAILNGRGNAALPGNACLWKTVKLKETKTGTGKWIARIHKTAVKERYVIQKGPSSVIL